MISLTLIITAIKGAGIATKIGLSVGAVAVVVGGIVGTAIIVNNTNKTPQTQQIAFEAQNDDNFPSEQKSTQNEDTGETEDDNSKGEQAADDKKPTTNNSQTTTQKPANSASSSNGQSTNSSSASKPSTPAAQPSLPGQPSASSQPSQPAQPAKKPDYNLNDKYIISAGSYEFYSYDLNLGQCKVAERKFLVGVTKFDGSGAEEWQAISKQYFDYAKAKGYNTYECIGLGSAPMTWQDAINMGIALDEAKCAQYGLSCGRW